MHLCSHNTFAEGRRLTDTGHLEARCARRRTPPDSQRVWWRFLGYRISTNNQLKSCQSTLIFNRTNRTRCRLPESRELQDQWVQWEFRAYKDHSEQQDLQVRLAQLELRVQQEPRERQAGLERRVRRASWAAVSKVSKASPARRVRREFRAPLLEKATRVPQVPRDL